MTKISARLSRWMLPPMLCVLLIACSEEDPNRRFANEPIPTEDAAATSTASGGVQVTFTPTLSSASPVAIDQALSAPGGASSIISVSGNDVIAFAPPWTGPRTVWSASGGQILTTSSMSAGNLIAVLVAPESSADRVDLILLDSAGTVIRTIENLGATITTPPAPESPDGTYSLSWSPDGTQVMVGLASGGILTVGQSGAPSVMVGPSRARAPGQVSWSPSGKAIGYISPSAPGLAGGLYVAPTGALPLDPVSVVPPSSGGRSTISRFAWSPDGTTLYYTNASTSGDPTFGGDLFRVPVAGGTASLVATASRVGPVSAITNFAVSPDGSTVAYVVTMPADDGSSVDSLWLQTIGQNEISGLPFDPREHVTSLTWTSDGLLWSTSPAGNAQAVKLYRAATSESADVIYDSTAATHVASPIASPIASPVASPVASPSPATPVAEN